MCVRLSLLASLCALALCTVPAHAQWGTKTKTERANADMGLGEYKGLKHAVGVKGFDNEAGWRGQWKLGDNLSVMLESALFDTGRFVVVEREQIKDIIAEQDLATSGRAAANTKVAQTGKIRLAKYLATGSVTEVEDAVAGGDGGIRIKGFNIGLKKNTAQVTIIAKLVDTTTSEVVAKERIVGKPGGIGIRLGYSGSGFGGDVGAFTKTPLGEAAQDAINQAAKWFATQMETFPFEGSVIRVGSNGQVLVNRGSEFGMQDGQVLVMRTAGEEVIDPDTGAILGTEEGEVIGRLKVVKVAEKFSTCDVLDGEKKPAAGTTVYAE